MIRSAVGGDQAYIASTWTRSICSMHKVPGKTSARFGRGHAMQRHAGSALWEHTSKLVDAVMDRADSRALVLCHPIDRSRIVAWALYVDGTPVPTIHYLYTRSADTAGEEQRRRGFATELLERIGVSRRAPVVCTSRGPSSDEMRARYPLSQHLPLEQFLYPTRRP